MAWLAIRYSVGNEHDPGDPWGRSELVIHPDGSAAGPLFLPAVPPGGPLPPGTALRQLSGEAVPYPTGRGPVVHDAVAVPL